MLSNRNKVSILASQLSRLIQSTLVVPTASVWKIPFKNVNSRARTKMPRKLKHGDWAPPQRWSRQVRPSLRHYPEANSQLPTFEDDIQNAPMFDSPNPYVKQSRKCLLCSNPHIKIDYKNPRLLSQFISNFTGRVYEHHITGLCKTQHLRVLTAIQKSRKAGYMSILGKNPLYLKDPMLFDPMKTVKANPY